jgi:integrase
MRKTGLLTDAEIRNAKPDPGKKVKRLLDGDRLYLFASVSLKALDLYQKGGIKWNAIDDINRCWVFRFEQDGERHDYGIGPYPAVLPAEARRRAAELRLLVIDGVDPMQEKADLKAERLAKKAERIKATTFKECAEAFYKIHHKGWTNAKHRQQWLSTMRDYVYPVIGDLNVADLLTAHFEKVLAPIWEKIPETAHRVQKRIEHVMNYAIAGKFTKNGDNPARYELLKARLGKVQRGNGHHAAVHFTQLPALVAELRKRDSMSARALEFTILGANRTGEVIGATWSEIDLKKRVWVIPAERMKADREHRVPLSDRAVEILKSLPHRGAHVFTGTNRKPLSNMAMLECLRGLSPGHTVHGTARSSFRDWAAERTNYPEFVIELCLAHRVGDAVVQAYKRTDVFARRTRLMAQWSTFLAKPRAPAATVDLDAERKKRRG